jgi:hypothetical protein
MSGFFKLPYLVPSNDSYGKVWNDKQKGLRRDVATAIGLRLTPIQIEHLPLYFFAATPRLSNQIHLLFLNRSDETLTHSSYQRQSRC